MTVYQFDSFVLDPKAGTLTGPDGQIHLRPRTFDLLQALIDGHPRLVTKKDLLDRVWKTPFISGSALAQAVSELRSALGDDSSEPKYIETCHRKGYRFIAEVVPMDTAVFLSESREHEAVIPSGSRKMLWSVLVGLSLVLIGLAFVGYQLFFQAEDPPQVLLMAASAPYGVFDPITRDAHLTNADDLSHLLSDLPVSLPKETTSPLWRREDQVRALEPDLIVIQYACFFDPKEEDSDDVFSSKLTRAEDALETFIRNIAHACPDTRLLVYSRHFEDSTIRLEWETGMVAKHPVLEGRLFTIGLPRESPFFRDPETGTGIKHLVMSILDLEV